VLVTISRIMPNICSTDLEAARDFYVELLGFSVAFESDWFVQLVAADDTDLAVGILRRDHDSIPVDSQRAPQGVILTVVVDDADLAHRRAVQLGVDVLLAPHDTPYGQRRLLVRDPDGAVVDISAPTAPLSDRYTS
jgi:catechol 2,3-dioxygenase-like lactoylglutathione lyase family enzyme